MLFRSSHPPKVHVPLDSRMSIPSPFAADPTPDDCQPSSPPAGGGEGWPETDHPTLTKLRSGSAAEQEEALRRLFLDYTRPVRSYIRHHWPRLQEAEVDDLTSEFVTLCLTGGKPHFLTYDPDQENSRVRLRTYLSRILDNLMSNAVNYTPEGGLIQVVWRRQAAKLVIDIANSGEPIPPEDVERVFEPFFQSTAKRRGPIKGSGVGLSVARECIELQGGTLTLVPNKYFPVCFRLICPAH